VACGLGLALLGLGLGLVTFGLGLDVCGLVNITANDARVLERYCLMSDGPMTLGTRQK